MNPHKIILADDHDILRAGLKSLIEKESQFSVVGEAKDGEELLSQLKDSSCDLVILDLSMPHLDGIAALKVIKRRYPKIKILVLTMQKDPEHFRQAMKAGASGYLLKEDAYQQLILGLKMILRNKKFVSPSVSALVADRYIRSLDEWETPSLEIFTKREREILKLIAQGLPNKGIAAKMKISVRTVETHRANLSNKLGIKNTAGLVRYAVSKGIV